MEMTFRLLENSTISKKKKKKKNSVKYRSGFGGK